MKKCISYGCHVLVWDSITRQTHEWLSTAKDQWIGNYYVDADGKWVKGQTKAA